MTTLSHLAGRMTATALKRLGVFDFVGGFALEAAIDPFTKAMQNIVVSLKDSMRDSPEMANTILQTVSAVCSSQAQEAMAAAEKVRNSVDRFSREVYGEDPSVGAKEADSAACSTACGEECNPSCTPASPPASKPLS